MRKGQRSGLTHAREDLAEHLEIKPRARDPRPPMVNDAHQRLQLAPSDPRWQMVPPYGWVRIDPGAALPGPASGERCWYCAQRVGFGECYGYSRQLAMVAHMVCIGDEC